MRPSPDGSHDIRIAREEAEVRSCWPAFQELRPHLRSEEELVERWRAQGHEDLVRFLDGLVAEGDRVSAAAVYRLIRTLAWGRILYVDDLVALQASHRRGLGTALLKYLQGEARRLGCDAVHLDTGYHRHLAHRAYLRNGFRIDCLHLSWQADRD